MIRTIFNVKYAAGAFNVVQTGDLEQDWQFTAPREFAALLWDLFLKEYSDAYHMVDSAPLRIIPVLSKCDP